MAYATTNPYTGEVVKTFPDATDAEVSQAIGAAHEAFLAWRERSFEERGAILQRAADLLRAAKAHAGLLTLEMGKITAEALAEVELSARIFEYYVKHAEALLAPEKLPVADPAEGDALLVHEPLGVILAIEPWNFPYYQIARILAPQLAAGNTLLLKHAANVPQSADAFEKLMLDAGLPRAPSRTSTPRASRSRPSSTIRACTAWRLTGSEGAGAVVAAQAGKALKKSTLELGRRRLRGTGRRRTGQDREVGGVRSPLECRPGLRVLQAHHPGRGHLRRVPAPLHRGRGRAQGGRPLRCGNHPGAIVLAESRRRHQGTDSSSCRPRRYRH
jgi:succinate-semialdehyde dehydrogenase/glutarate-semialdehyde dehydrogenase